MSKITHCKVYKIEFKLLMCQKKAGIVYPYRLSKKQNGQKSQADGRLLNFQVRKIIDLQREAEQVSATKLII